MRNDHKTHPDAAPYKTPVRQSAAQTSHVRSLWQRLPGAPIISALAHAALANARRAWKSPAVSSWRLTISRWSKKPYSGLITLVAGSVLITLLMWLSTRFFIVPNLGAVYIPLIAMLAYYWRWRLAIAGCVVELMSVYFLVLPPGVGFKTLDAHTGAQLLVLAAISVYVLLLVQLARNRRYAAEREVARFAALNTVGTALSGELHESQLLHLIARTACDLTGAGFAAFTLRPVDAMGQPLGPAEGSHFHLAAVVGATPEEEELFRRVPLGGEGILAPIFRHGVTVRVDDALALAPASHHAAMEGTAHEGHGGDGQGPRESPRDVARRQASVYAHGNATVNDLRVVGVPRGHPVVRSFLGAPLLDREGNVRGGLLLGHSEPGRFTSDDETLLQALAAQAAVALENARLYHNAQSQAEELNAVFESITDGVMVYDHQGNLLHENHAAATIRAFLSPSTGGSPVADMLNRLTADRGGIGNQGAYCGLLTDRYPRRCP